MQMIITILIFIKFVLNIIIRYYNLSSLIANNYSLDFIF